MGVETMGTTTITIVLPDTLSTLKDTLPTPLEYAFDTLPILYIQAMASSSNNTGGDGRDKLITSPQVINLVAENTRRAAMRAVKENGERLIAEDKARKEKELAEEKAFEDEAVKKGHDDSQVVEAALKLLEAHDEDSKNPFDPQDVEAAARLFKAHQDDSKINPQDNSK
ncbi:hypothetical protein J4E83_008208 [Alternaria metachromatica]|uniref:uncharacterized protein n=1 Tax=Alternaria metachromatica TaxID=283354 RepID=UPI0020C3B095|nr:uncharacterized protein J4E83_008208 [Alternaria metachromatica]KAI4610594.1 hypothetical protein J4E83_008208 [Alternaria metachromatica]